MISGSRGPYCLTGRPILKVIASSVLCRGSMVARLGLQLVEPRSRPGAVTLRFLATRTRQTSSHLLAVNRSPPLLTIVKALNGYSNNVFHLLSDRVGGPQAVEAVARKHLPSTISSEVIITNAAGAGEANRLSPRAAVAILWELRKKMRSLGKDLPTVLPVNGLDPGTLKRRLSDDRYRGCIVGKTGTSGSVGASALVGVLRTDRYGHVAFAILNSWLPVPEARRRQDAFLRNLIDATDAKPWDYVVRISRSLTRLRSTRNQQLRPKCSLSPNRPLMACRSPS